MVGNSFLGMASASLFQALAISAISSGSFALVRPCTVTIGVFVSWRYTLKPRRTDGRLWSTYSDKTDKKSNHSVTLVCIASIQTIKASRVTFRRSIPAAIYSIPRGAYCDKMIERVSFILGIAT